MNVRPVDGFLRLTAQATQGCAFWGGYVDIAAYFGDEIPQNPNFGGVDRRFQAKRTKY